MSCLTKAAFAVIALLPAAWWTPACAQGATLPAVRMIVGDHNHPYNFEQDGKVQGLGVDVANEVLRRARMTGMAEAYPWQRALALGKAVPNALLLTVTRTTERENAFYWIGPVAEREIWLYKLSTRKDIVVNTLADAKKYKVATTNGDAAKNTLLELGFVNGVNLDLSPYSVDIVRKMRVGRADLIPLNPFAAHLNDESFPELQLERVVLVTREGGYYLALSRKSDPALVDSLETAFASMQKDGSLQKIVNRWQVMPDKTKKPVK